MSNCGDDVVSVIIEAAEELEGIPYSQEDSFNRTDGTASNELLTGTSRNDLIQCFDGNNVICGLDGDDLLFGGEGRDIFIYNESEEFLNFSVSVPADDETTLGAIIGGTVGFIVGGGAFGFLVGAAIGAYIGSLFDDDGANNAQNNNAQNNTSQFSADLNFVNDIFASTLGTETVGIEDSWPISDALDEVVSVIIKAAEELEGIPSIQEDSFNIIDGTASNELLTGTSGKDLIRGFDGNDVIRGLDGDDLLFGGEGCDIFVYNEPEEFQFLNIGIEISDETSVGGIIGGVIGGIIGTISPIPGGVAAGASVGAAIGAFIGSLFDDDGANNAPANNVPNNTSQFSSELNFVSDIFEPILGVEANGFGDNLTISSDTLDDVVSVLTKAAEELEGIIDNSRDLLHGGDCTNGGELLATGDITQLVTNLLPIAVDIVSRIAVGGSIVGDAGGIVADGVEGFGRDVIKDFEKGFDQIQLNFSDLTFDTLNLSVVGNNTVIDLSSAFGNPLNSDTITVVGVTNLESSDFSFLG